MIKYYKFNRRSGNGTGWVKVKTRKNSKLCWFCDIYSTPNFHNDNNLSKLSRYRWIEIESQLKELKAEEIPKEEFIKAAIQYGR